MSFNTGKMALTNEFEPIRSWAKARGILDKGDIKTQTVKLGEEYGELCAALLRRRPAELADAIGDMVVVLTSVAAHNGLTIEQCVNGAFAEIADRRGTMVDGDFQKAEQGELFKDKQE